MNTYYLEFFSPNLYNVLSTKPGIYSTKMADNENKFYFSCIIFRGN